MADPESMVPQTNMPAYEFLNRNLIDPEYTRRKMKVLGFPFTEEQIEALKGKTEMDAMVAYLQKLGSDIGWRESSQTEIVGEVSNPFPGQTEAIAAGENQYDQQCAACHGDKLEGGIGPALVDTGLPDDELYRYIVNGNPEGGMPGFSSLGSKKLWQIVNYINYGEH